MPKTDKPKPTYGWAGLAEEHVDLKLTSGAVVQVRRPDPAGLIAAGLLDEFDTITATVIADTIPTAEGKTPTPAPAGTDLKALARQLDAMNRIVVHVVVQPTVVGTKAEADNGDGVWVGTVGLDDKTDIVAHATGGTAAMKPFRGGSEAAVGGVPDGG